MALSNIFLKSFQEILFIPLAITSICVILHLYEALEPILFFGGTPVLDYIISLLSGQHMNGVDYGAIGGFMFYRLLQGSIRRIMYKVEKIVVIYIAIFLAYKLYQFLG